MRISEALALQLDDLTEDGLIIRQTKFQKNRLLPLHATTRRALDEYVSARSRLCRLDGALFISNTGRAPAYPSVVTVFLQLARSIGLRAGPGKRGPRIHDLRHSFAVRSLERALMSRERSHATSSRSAPISAMGTSPLRIGISRQPRS
jgi:integrase